MKGAHVLVMAKEPVAGRVKTRLTPPFSPGEAAALAEAALADTLEAVARSSADRRIVALEGSPGPWLPPGFEVLAQRGDGFAARLACAWSDVGGPGVQIGMDTPQATADVLDDALSMLDSPDYSSLLGLASDGGWWAIGLVRGWEDDPFAGVPMSTALTGAAQLRRLHQLGHSVGPLPTLRDVDEVEDCLAVAGEIPDSRFAALLARTIGAAA